MTITPNSSPPVLEEEMKMGSSRSQPVLAPKSATSGASDPMERRQCLTPEAYYSWGQEHSRKLTVSVVFPFDIDFWGSGTHHIEPGEVYTDAPPSDAERLRVYDLQAAERKRIGDLVHDQMEIVAADAYRCLRALDARLGTESVAYGVRWARWKRTKEGPRPSPRGSTAIINGSPPDPAGQHGEGPPCDGDEVVHEQVSPPIRADLETASLDDRAALREAVERLHTRLEDNFAWCNGERVSVEPGSIPDGIECRDETIRQQRERITELFERARAAEEALREIDAIRVNPLVDNIWSALDRARVIAKRTLTSHSRNEGR